MVDSFNITQSESNAWGFTAYYDNVGGNVDGYYQVLVTNGDGDKASIYEFSISGTTATSSPQDKTLNASWASGEFLQQGGYTVAVPEPTSGLLMLVGLAGLALRRRRA